MVKIGSITAEAFLPRGQGGLQPPPPRRITSNLGGKVFFIGMPFKAKKEDPNSVLLICMNTNVVLIVG